MNINTPRGVKTPDEALDLFKSTILPAGSLLGIYTQLLEHAPDQAAEATRYVNENPEAFSEKIQRKAKEQASGRPIGAKRITSEAQALELLKSFGLRPQVRITFRADRPKSATNITALHPELIKFHDERAEMNLFHCVRISGEWQGIPRTYVVTINSADPADLDHVAKAFAAAIESVELMHNLNERVEAWAPDESLEAVLGSRDDVFYDESVFRQVCKQQGHALVASIENPNDSIIKIIIKIVPDNKINFLEKYIEFFDAAMAPA